MMISFSGWINQHLEEYHQTLRNMCREFHTSKAELKATDSSLAVLRGFNDLCLSMADKCQMQGDDARYSSILLDLHQQLINEMADEQRETLFRLQALQLARYSLSRLSHLLMQEGEWEQVCSLQEQFFCYSEQLS